MRWDNLKRFWRLRRELLKASLTLREKHRKTSRKLEDSLRLAALARKGFNTYLEVVEICGIRRVLRLRKR